MLLTVEEKNKGGICPSINRYVKSSNKYMKNWDENKAWLCLQYWK